MFPQPTLQIRDIDLGSLAPPEQQELRELVLDIFACWRGQSTWSEDRSSEVPLRAELSRRTEGKSGVDVYDLRISRKSDPSIRVSRFIIRRHHGDGGGKSAAQERANAQLLASTGSEIFSSRLLPLSSPNVVVYWHAGGELGQEEPESLSHALERALADMERAPEIALRDALERLSRELRHVFAAVQQPFSRTVSGDVYFHQVGHRLPPDIVIDATNLRMELHGQRLVLPWKKSTPGVNTELTGYTGEVLLDVLGDGTLPDEWIRIESYLNTAPFSPSRVVLHSEEVCVWLLIDPADSPAILGLDSSSPVELVFHGSCDELLTGTDHLQGLGFSHSATMSRAEFGSSEESVGQEARNLWSLRQVESKERCCSSEPL